MGQLTWGDGKEIVEICLELNQSNPDIVKEIRGRTGSDLISTVHQVFGLLAVADHPKAEERYESMRSSMTLLNHSPSWSVARTKLKHRMPSRERLA